MTTHFMDDFPDLPLEGAMSEPDLPDLRDLPALNEMFDFSVTGQTEISQSVVASQHDVAQSVQPLSDRGHSESHVPRASAIVEDLPSDDEDGLSAEGLGPLSDEELDEAETSPTEKPKWKIHHSGGDHRLNGMCVLSVRATDLTIPSTGLHCPGAVGQL
jgi:hypothetical protein